jgi:hypothetical protein
MDIVVGIPGAETECCHSLTAVQGLWGSF